ncbi:MAG: sensor domain-containing diguanylate cyclase [Actinomycetota bacterium]|nr:sensor domain-containing diguanylate cyclase [Actinomycetota bacterium]
MPQTSPDTGTSERIHIVGSRGGTRRGLVRLLEVAPFTVAGVAVIILIPADPILKLLGTVVILSIALFRAVAEIRGWAAWIQKAAPIAIALLIGFFTIVSQEPVMNVIMLINVMRVALVDDRRIMLLTLGASLVGLLVPAIIYPHELASSAAIWSIVLVIISFPIQSRSTLVRAQAGLNAKLAGVISELLTSDDSRKSIVSAAHELGEADVAILFEVEPDGSLKPTAGSGIDVNEVKVDAGNGSVIGLSVANRETVFVPMVESVDFSLSPELGSGGLMSVITCPIIRDGETAGALLAGWKTRVQRADHLGPSIIRILAGEAASTLKHSEMLVSLAESATRDPLTGLPNRRAWNRLLRTGLLESNKVMKPMSIAVLDLDHFKKFNDEHGHQEGDRLLREISSAWKDALRKQDMLFRWGGEEFTVILPDCGQEQSIEVVERLRAATPRGETTSVGVATWDGHETADQLFDRTDAALYRAKEIGRNRTVSAGVLSE